MRRFFLPSLETANSAITVTGDLFWHMAKVLRIKPGASVILSDGRGCERVCVIESVGRESLSATVTDSLPAHAASGKLEVSIYQGLPKGEKMDLILQKSTELGAAEIVPFVAERSIPKIKRDREEAVIKRWQRITQEAARQSNSGFIPRVGFARSLSEVLCISKHPVKLLLWEEEHAARLQETFAKIPTPESLAVLIGPEGGFSSAEVEQAVESGFLPVSLGHRIVRTETASLAIMAILQFCWGDIG